MESLVGRSDELSRLTSLLSRLTDGPRAAILVGDSGVGKTRLLQAFLDDATARGFAVLRADCVDLGGEWPFQPIRAALDRAQTHEQTLNDARLTSILGDAREALQGNASLERLHDAFTDAARHRPLILALDDLQWADQATRRLLLSLLSEQAPCELLAVAAATATDLHADTPLNTVLEHLARMPRFDQIPVLPLGLSETAQLLRGLGWTDVAHEEALRVWQRTGGNPFFITAIGAHDDDPTALPDSLRTLLLRRLHTQPELVIDVVQTVAAAAGPVPHEVLVAVVDEPERAVNQAVRQAVDANLLQVVETDYAPAHRLLTEAVRENLLPGQARGLHRRYAETYAALLPQARAARAFHWREAGRPELALPELVAAAGEATGQQPPVVIWQLWRAAIEVAGELPQANLAEDLLLDAAAAASRAGDDAAAIALVDRLPTAVTDLGLTRARYLAGAGRVREALEVLDELLAGELDPVERDTVLAFSAELLLREGSFHVARERAARLLPGRDLPTHGPSRSVVLAGVALGFSEAYLGNQATGRHWLQFSLTQAEHTNDPELAGTAYKYLSDLLSGPLNDLEEGVRVARAGAARLAELGAHGPMTAALVAAGANGLFRLGRWSEAIAWVSDELGNGHTGYSLADLLLSRSRLAMGLGELVEAERDLHSAGVILAEDAGPAQVLPLATLRAGAALWHEDLPAARQAVVEGMASVPVEYEDQWRLAPLIWHGLRVESQAAANGQPVDAERVSQLQVERRRCLEASSGAVREVVLGYELLCAAETSRIEERSDPVLWAAAADHWDQRTHPYPATYARLHQAQALFQGRSRNREAAQVLRTAYLAAVAMEARPLAAQALALAELARVDLGQTTPPQPHVSGRQPNPAVVLDPVEDPIASLTDREREVLSLVAQGQTNKEIGKHLFISERTVGVHVSRLLAKLGARSRVEASAVFLRRQPQQQ